MDKLLERYSNESQPKYQLIFLCQDLGEGSNAGLVGVTNIKKFLQKMALSNSEIMTKLPYICLI